MQTNKLKNFLNNVNRVQLLTILALLFSVAAVVLVFMFNSAKSTHVGAGSIYGLSSGSAHTLSPSSWGCSRVSNSSGRSIAIPMGTNSEWQAFRSNAGSISGVSVCNGSGCTGCGSSYGYQYQYQYQTESGGECSACGFPRCCENYPGCSDCVWKYEGTCCQ